MLAPARQVGVQLSRSFQTSAVRKSFPAGVPMTVNLIFLYLDCLSEYLGIKLVKNSEM